MSAVHQLSAVQNTTNQLIGILVLAATFETSKDSDFKCVLNLRIQV